MESKMTAKGFFKKLNSKAAASALGFIAAHREYMLGGELAELTKPILDKVESGELFPTPAINELKEVIAGHIIKADKKKADEAIKKSSGGVRTVKLFEAFILDNAGRIVLDDEGEELTKRFEKPQEAERWVDRRLFDRPNTIGEVLKHGDAKKWAIITREDAIARILRKPRSAVLKRRPSPGNLSGGMKVGETKVTFSAG